MLNKSLLTALCFLFVGCSSDSPSVSSSPPSVPPSNPPQVETKNPPQVRISGRYFFKKNQWRLISADLDKSILTSTISWCEFDGSANDTCHFKEWRHVVQNKTRILIEVDIPDIKKTSLQSLPQFYKTFMMTKDSSKSERESFLKKQREFASEYNGTNTQLITLVEKFNLQEINISQLIEHFYQTSRCRNYSGTTLLAQMCPQDHGNYLVYSRTLGSVDHFFKNANFYLEIEPKNGELKAVPFVVTTFSSLIGNLPSYEKNYENLEISGASGYKPSMNDLIAGAKQPQWATQARNIRSACDAAYNQALNIYSEVRSTPYTPIFSVAADATASTIIEDKFSGDPASQVFSETGESFPWNGQDPGHYPESFEHFLDKKTFLGGHCAVHF